MVNKLMAGNETVATAVILDQFYKNLELPVPAEQEATALTVTLAMGCTDTTFDTVDVREQPPYQYIYLPLVTRNN